jgi:uncharacterized membrane protein
VKGEIVLMVVFLLLVIIAILIFGATGFISGAGTFIAWVVGALAIAWLGSLLGLDGTESLGVFFLVIVGLGLGLNLYVKFFNSQEAELRRKQKRDREIWQAHIKRTEGNRKPEKNDIDK